MNQDKNVTVASTSLALVASLVAALVAGNCSSSTDPAGGGSPPPFIRIQSAIADGTTNAGPGPFPVSFYGAGRMLDAATTVGLLARLRMSTWPEGTPIAVTPMLDPGSNATTATAQVSVDALLDDRWYVLGFGPAETGLTCLQTLDDGTWGVRLRPDSHPVVSVAAFCEAADVGMKFIVTFSEPVMVDRPSEALTVQRNGAVMTCRLDGVSPTEVHQFCGDLAAGPVTVSLAAGIISGPDGAFLAPQDWAVDIATLPLVQTGCHGYRIPL